MKPTIGRIVHLASEISETISPAIVVGVREVEGCVEPLVDLVVFSTGYPTASTATFVMAKDEPERPPGRQYWSWPPRE